MTPNNNGNSHLTFSKWKNAFLIQERSVYLSKNSIFATFRFNIQYVFFTQYAFPESGKRFFAPKISNSDSPYQFTFRGVISRKIFENFFMWVPPSYCVVAPRFWKFFKKKFWNLNKFIIFCEIQSKFPPKHVKKEIQSKCPLCHMLWLAFG